MMSVVAMGDYLEGRFVLSPTPTEVIDQPSSADLADRIGAFPVDVSHVDVSVAAARRASVAWRRTPLEVRLAHLKALRTALLAREAAFVERLGREIGKPAWEAKSEVQALASKIDITLGEGLALVRDVELDGGKLSIRYKPHGVLAVVGPFNFPLHLPHGHIVPALATGNTVVFKPSEVAPATAQLYAEAVHEAGFPPGVFNLVQGARATGEALSAHPDIDGVLFTGSPKVGSAIIAANISRPGRMLALELGGRNAGLVLEDAPFEKALHDVVYSAFVTAGQRCTALSRVFVARTIADRFIPALVERTKVLVLGHPASPETFHGPLATRRGFDSFQRVQVSALADGYEPLLPPAPVPDGLNGYYARASMHRVHTPSKSNPYETEELFGPELALYVVGDLEEACALANDTPYGLAASVFTEDAARFVACAERLDVGCLGWNSPTVGASSRLPFGGIKQSGNQRPAGLFSTLYCTYPQAITRGEATLDPAKTPRGMRWR
jgi:succinylglutamic semialdehyde dehydrogenase